MALLLVTASACRSGDGPAAPASSSPSPAVFSLDRAVLFSSLDELAQHSSVVAVVRATPQAEVIETPDGFIYTLRTVEVVLAVRGTSEGTWLIVRQPARDIDTLEDLPPHLVDGGEYLLFLDQFHLSGGGVTDDYMVTGLSGQFEKTAPDKYRRQDPLSTDLPETISEVDAIQAVARMPYEPPPS